MKRLMSTKGLNWVTSARPELSLKGGPSLARYGEGEAAENRQAHSQDIRLHSYFYETEEVEKMLGWHFSRTTKFSVKYIFNLFFLFSSQWISAKRWNSKQTNALHISILITNAFFYSSHFSSDLHLICCTPEAMAALNFCLKFINRTDFFVKMKDRLLLRQFL